MSIAILVAGKPAAFASSPTDIQGLVQQLVADGVEVAKITVSVPDLKTWANARVDQMAEIYRSKLASTSAGKLAEYRVKEEIARDPASATDAELAMIDREATARKTDRAGLLTVILQRAGAYRQIALLVGALEAEAKTAIAAVSNGDPNAAAAIGGILNAAQTSAEEAFGQAQQALAV